MSIVADALACAAIEVTSTLLAAAAAFAGTIAVNSAIRCRRHPRHGLRF